MPILKSINRSEVRVFLEKYKKYHLLVTERARLVGDDKLLRTLAKYEPRKTVGRLTNEDVNEYLRKVLEPDRYFAPDLDRLFGRLRLRSTGDGRDRVTALFSEIDEIIADNGLGYLPQKDIIKFMYKALPRQVEKTVKTILKVEEDDEAGKSLDPKLVNDLDGMKFFSGTSGQPLGSERREALRREGIKCFDCGGPHTKRNCPTGRGTARERGWAFPGT